MPNWLGVYGPPELMLLHNTLVVKRETEVTAALHIWDPTLPRFVAAPDIPSLLYCCKCRGRKPHASFDVDVRYTLRAGRRTECKECRSKERKQQRLSRSKEKRQQRRDLAYAG